MATLQVRNRSYRILFCLHGRRHTFTIGKVGKKEAELTAANVDRILLRIEQKLLAIPPGVDVIEFVKNDGRIQERELLAPLAVSFGELRDKYLAAHDNGAMEANSISTLKLHLKHIGDTLGERFPIRDLTFADVQGHIERRRIHKYRGGPIGAVTIRKELSTFRAVWNWGTAFGMLSGQFPSRGLAFPKTDEKPHSALCKKSSGRSPREG